MATLFFPESCMSIDWNWGIFLQQAPFGNTTYPGWLWSGFQITVALSISASDHRFSRRLTVRHFTHGPQSLPLGHWHLLCRTVSQRAADRAVLYPVPGGAGVPAGKYRHVV